jgi:hypothetical protein
MITDIGAVNGMDSAPESEKLLLLWQLIGSILYIVLFKNTFLPTGKLTIGLYTTTE